MIKKSLFAFSSGLIFSFGFAPFDLWMVSILSVAILSSLLKGLSKKESFLIGYIYGLGMWLTGISWLYVSIHYHGNISQIGSAILILVFVAILALYSGILLLLNKFLESGTSKAILFLTLPTSWVLIEILRSYLFTGFPWLISGTMLADTLADGFTPIIGAQGNTFLIVLIGSLVYQIYYKFNKKKSALLPAILLGFLVISSFVFKSIEWTTLNKEIKVSLFQPNLTLEDKWSQKGIIKTHNLIEKAIDDAEDRELILFPETALILSEKDNKSFIDSMNYKSSKKNLTLITGIVEREDENRIKNRLITLGSVNTHYDKIKLVPFGEFIPLKSYLGGFLDIIGLNLTDTIPGSDVNQINTGEYTVSPSICYEIAFDNFVRKTAKDSNLLLTVSNDTWFGQSFGPIQHLEIAQNRALEHKKPLIRATNSGISAFISRDGKIIEKQDYFEEKKLSRKLNLYSGSTFYAKYGNLPIIILIMFYLGLIIIKSLFLRKKYCI